MAQIMKAQSAELGGGAPPGGNPPRHPLPDFTASRAASLPARRTVSFIKVRHALRQLFCGRVGS
jgi:hypothetical protein